MRFADPLSIKFSKPTVKTLKQQARAEKKPVSQLIRELIEQVLAGNGKE